jgi:hypothetical protein
MSRTPALLPASGGLPARLKPHFEALWAAYPARRPNPRAKAEARFAALATHARPEDIAAAAEAFAAECRAQKIDGPFVPHLATWLSERRFMDYPPFATLAAAPHPTEAEPDHAWWPSFRGRISITDFRHWIAPLVVLAQTDGEGALVQAPSRFHADRVRANHASLVARALGVKRVVFDGTLGGPSR